MPRYILETSIPEKAILEALAPLVYNEHGANNTFTLKPMRRKLEVHGRRWFQRSYGNTYHTVRIVLDGETVYTSPKTYGYGDSYRQTATEWLVSAGHVTNEDARRYFLRELFDYTETVQDVARERDL